MPTPPAAPPLRRDGDAAVGLTLAGCLPIPAPKGLRPVSLPVLASRGLLSGCFVFVAVLLARTSAVAAGMATSFPAVFGTICVSLYVSQGADVQGGAMGPLILGAVSVAAYCIVFAVSAAALGTLPACFLAYGLALGGVSVPVAAFLHWRRHGAKGTGGGEGGGGSNDGGGLSVNGGGGAGGAISDGVALQASCNLAHAVVAEAWDEAPLSVDHLHTLGAGDDGSEGQLRDSSAAAAGAHNEQHSAVPGAVPGAVPAVSGAVSGAVVPLERQLSLSAVLTTG